MKEQGAASSETSHSPRHPGGPHGRPQVTCITKRPYNSDPYDSISHLGGSEWRWTKEQVIASIRAGTNTFFTMVNGSRADIGVVEGPNGPYLRTHANKRWNDNLLALPECPG